MTTAAVAPAPAPPLLPKGTLASTNPLDFKESSIAGQEGRLSQALLRSGIPGLYSRTTSETTPNFKKEEKGLDFFFGEDEEEEEVSSPPSPPSSKSASKSLAAPASDAGSNPSTSTFINAIRRSWKRVRVAVQIRSTAVSTRSQRASTSRSGEEEEEEELELFISPSPPLLLSSSSSASLLSSCRSMLAPPTEAVPQTPVSGTVRVTPPPKEGSEEEEPEGIVESRSQAAAPRTSTLGASFGFSSSAASKKLRKRGTGSQATTRHPRDAARRE